MKQPATQELQRANKVVVVWGINRDNLKHLGVMLRRGKSPAPKIYESIGAENLLAPAPGWLNVGYWEAGQGFDDAAEACGRLVKELCAPLARRGRTIDVGNGLGAQDPVIKQSLDPRELIAVNITHSQLVAGRSRLESAGARPVVADAVNLPFQSGVVDGIISVEAAFHFTSRQLFFDESFRVLRPGGRISFSDITVERRPAALKLKLTALAELRVWGVRFDAAVAASTIGTWLEESGFVEVRVQQVSESTIDPGVKFFREKLKQTTLPPAHRFAAHRTIEGWASLREAGVLEYVLIDAKKPT